VDSVESSGVRGVPEVSDGRATRGQTDKTVEGSNGLGKTAMSDGGRERGKGCQLNE